MVLAVNVALTVWGCFSTNVKNFGFWASMAAAMTVLFWALAAIANTIKSVQNAFPNEKFVWTNVWNLIIFCILSLIAYVLAIASE